MNPDISVIITAHREGVVAGATVKSAAAAISFAAATCDVNIEVIVVLDRSDAVTSAVLTDALGTKARIICANEGDPGQSRNFGIRYAEGTYSTFLDADDLWSHNWLSEAWKFSQRHPKAILHSTLNVTFGREKNLWWHIDSEGVLFEPEYLRWGNYWDAMSFSDTEIYRTYPFKRNDLQLGFGHEDWHWNWVTNTAGIPHKPVPNTIHFKRRRRSSQMSKVAASDSLVWPIF